MTDDRLSLRVPVDLLGMLDEARGEQTRSAWLLGLMDRELSGASGGQSQPDGALPAVDAIPCPGVLCMWAACHDRDTARYGVTDPAELARRNYREQARDENKAGHALCRMHAALLSGLIYRRPVPPGASRVLGVPAA